MALIVKTFHNNCHNRKSGDLIPGSFVNTTEETLQPDCNNYNWQNDKCKYKHHIIGEMPSWVKSKKDTFSVALPQQNIDISTFTDNASTCIQHDKCTF